MSAAPSIAAFADAARGLEPRRAASPVRFALLGTGNVGTAVLARLAGWRGSELARHLRLVHVAGARRAIVLTITRDV